MPDNRSCLRSLLEFKATTQPRDQPELGHAKHCIRMHVQPENSLGLKTAPERKHIEEYILFQEIGDMTLTDKQKKFAEVLASGTTTTTAALSAGYGEAAAASVGSRLSRDFRVLAYINSKRLSALEQYKRKTPLTLAAR